MRRRHPAGLATRSSRNCALDLEQRKKIAAEIQTRAATLGTHYPLGEWYGMMVHRTNTKGWQPPMTAMLFWNAEKTGP